MVCGMAQRCPGRGPPTVGTECVRALSRRHLRERARPRRGLCAVGHGSPAWRRQDEGEVRDGASTGGQGGGGGAAVPW